MKKFEIQVMVQENLDGPMVLLDRCTLEADNAADAARRYAALFQTV